MTGLYSGGACRATGCQVKVPSSKLMCAPHWSQVPRAQQQAVYAAWRNYQRDARKYAGELRAAQQDAVEAIQ